MCSLVIEVIHSFGGHLLSQTKYFPGLPASAALTEDNVVDTHLRSILRWNPLMEFFPIPPIIDRLLVVLFILQEQTKCYSVHICQSICRYPSIVCWAVLPWILWYLKGTWTRSLYFSSCSSPNLTSYLGSDLAGDIINDQCSTTRFCIFLGLSLICRKHETNGGLSLPCHS